MAVAKCVECNLFRPVVECTLCKALVCPQHIGRHHKKHRQDAHLAGEALKIDGTIRR